MDDDKDLLDIFAVAAMMSRHVHCCMTDAEFAQRCWKLALAMKMERDRIIDSIEAKEVHDRT